MLRERGIRKRLIVAETDSLPYACRQIEPGRVDIWGIKTSISIAALPALENQRLMETLQDLFPIPLRVSSNILEIGFSNMNMIFHCPTMILNAARIEEGKGNFKFYAEGISKSVCKVIEHMDKERLAIGEKLNLHLKTAYQWLKELYNLKGETLHELLVNSPVYGGHGPDAPKELNHRYLSEDVPYLLVPVASFGRLLGIKTPVIDSIILLAEILNEANYSEEGRNLNRLGLSGMSGHEILEYVNQKGA
jgi:opine dehydrogenase